MPFTGRSCYQQEFLARPSVRETSFRPRAVQRQIGEGISVKHTTYGDSFLSQRVEKTQSFKPVPVAVSPTKGLFSSEYRAQLVHKQGRGCHPGMVPGF
jgi:hypothetical protein